MASKFPNQTSTFSFLFIAVLLIIGLLFWAAGAR